MADLDITLLILSEHDAFRRGFTDIDSLTDPADLATKWRELSDSLEVHASGEEDVFYPQLLHRFELAGVPGRAREREGAVGPGQGPEGVRPGQRLGSVQVVVPRLTDRLGG